MSQRAYFRKRKISSLNKKLNFFTKKIKKDVLNKNLFIYNVFNVIGIKKISDMDNISAQLKNQIDELKKLQKSVIAYEQAQRQQLYAGKITDLKAFGKMLNDKRKSLGIELSMLELQTGVSISTLNRLFQDPSQVRFTTVFLVAKTLGVSLCAI